MNIELSLLVYFWSGFLASITLFVWLIRNIPGLTSDKSRAFWGGLIFGMVALVFCSIAGIFFAQTRALYLILLMSVFMLFSGIFDDRKEFTPQVKFIVHIGILILYFILGGKRILFHALPDFLSYIVSALWIIGITNAFNHLDIKDGLAGGIAFFIAVVLGFIAFYTGNYDACRILVCFLGSIAAFMIFNLHPAKIYMGNAGSHFIGFFLSTMAMYIDYNQSRLSISSIVPLCIFLVPIIDTAILIISRLKKGVSIAQKTDDHLFFYCEQRFGFQQSLWIFWGATFLSGTAGFVIFYLSYVRS